ncbi:MAG: 4Fe-4S dicluster domain-containing protein [Ginsengibacter sp.]
MNDSISLSLAEHRGGGIIQKLAVAMATLALLFFIVICINGSLINNTFSILVTFVLASAGGILYAWPLFREKAGIKNNNIMFDKMTSRGVYAFALGIFLTGFYVLLYWFPYVLTGMIRIMDPVSQWLRGENADQWFLYGSMYTVAILIMGIRFIAKYRHSRYQVIRTISVTFFQLGFAFLIPAFLKKLNQPEFYFSYFWPLKYNYLFPGDVYSFLHNGGIGIFMIFWGAVMTFIATPILTYKYGKRWYCSWVCGCGGLAETMGDPYRQLSNKSLKAWKFERISIYSVLIFVTVTTVLLWVNSAFGGSILGGVSGAFSQWYGFFIGSIFAGVIGTGFYPIFGGRVWCRFGCPMAAILGIFQKYKSKFRITTNGGQCISCGNCSTYCEMGIDVKWYAQRGQNIVRASCVGCGICSAVCPRGVLNLENLDTEGRVSDDPIIIGNKGIEVKL